MVDLRAADRRRLADAFERRCADAVLSTCGPYCNAQLRAFQRATDKLDGAGIKVVSLSVDDEAATRELIAKHHLTFPVGHSADAAAIHEATGAFVNVKPTYLQATGFVVDPEGKVIVSVYSSGAIGRLLPDDVAGLVTYVKSQQPARPWLRAGSRRTPRPPCATAPGIDAAP